MKTKFSLYLASEKITLFIISFMFTMFIDTCCWKKCESLLNGVRLLQELSPKSLDQLVSYGERCSVRIMAARLNQLGVPAAAYDAWEVGIHTDRYVRRQIWIIFSAD